MKKDFVYMDYIKKMTSEEKISLLSGRDIWSTKPIERLQIPAIYFSDGPHGVRKQTGAADHLGLHKSLPATCFPTESILSCSWDTALLERVGESLGSEAAALKVNVLLGPGINIKRDPLCGRNFEYFSEDPYLSGKMAAAYIRGVQKNGIGACLKHFAVNNRETLRMVNNCIIDERTLREIYLTAFEIAVKEGKPKAVMSSYNQINGIYANENEHLLQDILRQEWKYEGAVITDWGGGNDHIAGVKAGSSLEMPGTAGDSDRQLMKAVKEGKIDEKEVDKRAIEVLKLVFETQTAAEDCEIRTSHHAEAQKAAEESIVLLKNDKEILPIMPDEEIGIIGEFAKYPRYQGAGSSVVNPTRLDSMMSIVENFPLNVKGYARGYRRNKKSDKKMIREAIALAEKVSKVLLCIGLDENSESEGMDRKHLRLPSNQLELLRAIAQVNQNIVVILSAGSVVEMPWITSVKGILYGGLGGQAQAGAILRAITGQINPGGKLTETYPLNYEDTPTYDYWTKDFYISEYREEIYVGYRYYETVGLKVRFPFGFGLSYTTFTYSNLLVGESGVSFELENTGNRAGAEIAQLYVGGSGKQVYRPIRELKGFAKVMLQPGEKKKIEIPFDEMTFRYYDITRKQWQTENGKYMVMIGASIEDIRLWKLYNLQEEENKEENNENNLCPRSCYSGCINKIQDKEFEALLGYKLPKQEVLKRRSLEMNDAVCMLENAKSSLARFIFYFIKKYKERREKKNPPDLNILFIYNMPFRGIAKMMNGVISMDMTRALLVMINGHFIKGAAMFLKSFLQNHQERYRIKGGKYEEEMQ